MAENGVDAIVGVGAKTARTPRTQEPSPVEVSGVAKLNAQADRAELIASEKSKVEEIQEAFVATSRGIGFWDGASPEDVRGPSDLGEEPALLAGAEAQPDVRVNAEGRWPVQRRRKLESSAEKEVDVLALVQVDVDEQGEPEATFESEVLGEVDFGASPNVDPLPGAAIGEGVTRSHGEEAHSSEK